MLSKSKVKTHENTTLRWLTTDINFKVPIPYDSVWLN